MTYKNQTEYLKTDIEKILAQHIRVVEENMKRITGKNKDDIQKNLSVSLDQLKKDMTHLMGVKVQATDRAESANVVFVKSEGINDASTASEFVVKIIQKDAHINKGDVHILGTFMIPNPPPKGPQRNQKELNTFKVVFASRSQRPIPSEKPGKPRSLVTVLFDQMIKNPGILKHNDKIVSVNRQIPNYLLNHKKELEKIGDAIRKGQKGPNEKSIYQTKVVFVASLNTVQLKFKKRDPNAKWTVLQQDSKEFEKNIIDHLKKIQIDYIIDEKQI